MSWAKRFLGSPETETWRLKSHLCCASRYFCCAVDRGDGWCRQAKGHREWRQTCLWAVGGATSVRVISRSGGISRKLSFCPLWSIWAGRLDSACGLSPLLLQTCSTFILKGIGMPILFHGAVSFVKVKPEAAGGWGRSEWCLACPRPWVQPQHPLPKCASREVDQIYRILPQSVTKSPGRYVSNKLKKTEKWRGKESPLSLAKGPGKGQQGKQLFITNHSTPAKDHTQNDRQ